MKQRCSVLITSGTSTWAWVLAPQNIPGEWMGKIFFCSTPVEIDIHIYVLVITKISVAAHLRSLRSDDPPNKGHPRAIKQGLKLWENSDLHIQTFI